MHAQRLAVALTLVAALGCTSNPPGDAPDGEPFVVATVAPIVDLVAHVMGGPGAVEGLVPPGVDSHTHEPRPGDARTLSRADVFVANGLFLEEPALRLAAANLRDDAAVVELAELTIAPDDWVFDWSFPEAQGHPNPHLWMSVGYAMRYVEHIAAALARADPDGEEQYRANAEAYLAELRALDAAIAEAVGTIPEANRRAMSMSRATTSTWSTMAAAPRRTNRTQQRHPYRGPWAAGPRFDAS
jgi:ABC-type Zn uptake system ZnuABC Zn-binding protein ZnuA